LRIREFSRRRVRSGPSAALAAAGALVFGIAAAPQPAASAELTQSALVERVDNTYWRPLDANHDRIVERLDASRPQNEPLRAYERRVVNARRAISALDVSRKAQSDRGVARRVFTSLLSESRALRLASQALAGRRRAVARRHLRSAERLREGAEALYGRRLGFLNLGSYAPTDFRIIASRIYPQSSLVPPAPGPMTEGAVLAEIRRVVRARAGRSGLTQALRFYRDPRVVQKIPEANLRGAFAMLTGTVGEAAQAHVRSSAVAGVRFAPPSAVEPFAEVFLNGPGGTIVIEFNEEFRNERPSVLASVAAHEALHQDTNVVDEEEVVAHALDTIVFAQIVEAWGATPSSPARVGTTLAQTLSTRQMGRLNSRRSGRLVVTTPSFAPLFPGATRVAPNFADIKPPLQGLDSPGNRTLTAMLKAYLENDRLVRGTPTFAQALRLLDRHNPDPEQLSIDDMREVALKHLKLRPVHDE